MAEEGGWARRWRELQASWERSRQLTVPSARPAPAPTGPEALRIAWLVYRGNPRCGGQGVYTRHVARELAAMGHSVTVFAGQPWPELDDGVGFVPVPSLDLYRDPDPFRLPHPRELRSLADLAELAIMCSAGFPEPRTFSWRAHRLLREARDRFDLVHDNQCLGSGLLRILDDGWPLLTTIHHPITVDRELALAHAEDWRQQLAQRRWFGFLGMQARVAQQLPRVVTVSRSSRRDIAGELGVDPARTAVVPVGVDHTVFRPRPEVRRVPGRIMVTSSSDVPMKGLVPLLHAVARLRAERPLEVTVIGTPRPGGLVARTIEALGLGGAVSCLQGISDEELAVRYAEAEVAVVPSLYEGFSLPAVEAMACGVPLVATTGGAIPEVVGASGRTALLVRPGDPEALAAALREVLDRPELAARLGAAGRQRVLQRFTWRATAEGTVEQYRLLLEQQRAGRGGRQAPPPRRVRARWAAEARRCRDLAVAGRPVVAPEDLEDDPTCPVPEGTPVAERVPVPEVVSGSGERPGC
ncbi:glycosyltransferase family 4 protein [Aciditerrimonas ferrireducens]|uniref:glycosyltransferase family 4 protein n=1 Tax=Aciditerrimonas ferrireducens TaxID=667306 RepID=UPI0020063E80|nr:glycosyltransferase family 4 protein [Aciditerrimonas ferrireducens]MCK4176255.1 glycosyltransferase family 4 protein [Aciditerrimonas ferrireducens]